MGIGATLDDRASDPQLIEKTLPVVSRMGPAELELLKSMAERHRMTRSKLTRVLVVKGLLELQQREAC